MAGSNEPLNPAANHRVRASATVRAAPDDPSTRLGMTAEPLAEQLSTSTVARALTGAVSRLSAVAVLSNEPVWVKVRG